MSRDPIGEEGSYNIYVFAKNNGLLFTDSLGLYEWTWIFANLGKREPVIRIDPETGTPYRQLGNTSITWDTTFWTTPNSSLKCAIDAKGEQTSKIWWSDGNSSYSHEWVHVNRTKAQWEGLAENVRMFIGGGPYCCDKAKCLVNVLSKIASVFKKAMLRDNYQWDCDQDKWPSDCREAARLAGEVPADWAETLKDLNKCK
jgi:hypothetical protein